MASDKEIIFEISKLIKGNDEIKDYHQIIDDLFQKIALNTFHNNKIIQHLLHKLQFNLNNEQKLYFQSKLIKDTFHYDLNLLSLVVQGDDPNLLTNFNFLSTKHFSIDKNEKDAIEFKCKLLNTIEIIFKQDDSRLQSQLVDNSIQFLSTFEENEFLIETNCEYICDSFMNAVESILNSNNNKSNKLLMDLLNRIVHFILSKSTAIPSKMIIFCVKIYLELIIYNRNQIEEDNLIIIYQHIESFHLENIDSLFLNQDDDFIIDFCYSCLKFQVKLKENQIESLEIDRIFKESKLNSHIQFVKLLASISFDYKVIIDWLISNETIFLKYFITYLKYLIDNLQKNNINEIEQLFNKNEADFNDFNQKLKGKYKNFKSNYYLNETFKTLSLLKIQIIKLKRSIPYNCEPLIKLLNKIKI
jgi:hypothetical protein